MKRGKILLILALLVFVLSSALPSMAYDIKIGLIYSKEQGRQLGDGIDRLKNYRDAIQGSGGKPVPLIQGEDPKETLEKLKTIYGLIIPGGFDVEPKLFKEQRYYLLEETDLDFDKFEMWLIDKAIEKKIPILGICRGIQVLNVHFGGSLYQDIPTQYRPDTRIVHRLDEVDKTGETEHQIVLTRGTLLWRLLGRKEKINVNSYHHQGLKNIPGSFTINAVSEDALVEGIERGGAAPILGVQFHPERMRKKDPAFETIFRWLIGEADKRIPASMKVVVKKKPAPKKPPKKTPEPGEPQEPEEY